MRNLLNRKGISDVVAVSTLILLTVVAASMVYVSVLGTINKAGAQLSPEISCLEMQGRSPFELKDACYNQNTKEIEVKMKRKLGNYDLSGVDFVVSTSNGEMKKWQCGDLCGNCILPNIEETKNYYFSFSDSLNLDSLEIYAEKCLISSRKIRMC
ncbi:MAG: hypothetical protein AABY10_06145 [Nanoarchaeota archaeon]